jgi:hypothetical protein
MTDQTDDTTPEAIGSRVEAAVAGQHHEHAEADAGVEPRGHVTAVDVVDAPHLAHHHPADPNAGVVRGRMGRGALPAAAIAAAVTIAGVILLALAIGAR